MEVVIMPRDTILFDINETVLDLSVLKPKFKAAFGSESITALWFSMLLHSSTVCIVTNVKTNFATLAGDMLDAVAARLEVQISEAVRNDILNSFASLPPHADIKPALTRLRSAGYRTVAFSNSSLNLIKSQMENAGLMEYFDEIVSVEETGSFKPDPGVYEFVAQRIHRPVNELRLVAAHDWDTHGALSAGMHAACITRSNAPYHPRYRQHDVVAGTMEDIVEKIIAVDGKK
jgi:2-haloacid dehalogenase